MVSTAGTYLQSSFYPDKDEGRTALVPLSVRELRHILSLKLSTNSLYILNFKLK